MSEPAMPTSRAGASSAARWVVVIVLAALAGALGGELLLSASPAAADTASGGAGKVFAVAGQITGDTYGLYLVDLENGTICLYEYVGRERRLWLRAARTFRADLKLDAYNTQPSPEEVSKMVSEARRLKDRPAPTRP